MDRNSSPFSRREANLAGVADGPLRSTEYRRLFRGVYVGSAVEDTLPLRTKAVLQHVAPDGFASHHTAAKLWGGVPPRSALIHVSRPTKKRRSVKQGLMVHLAGVETRTTRFRGIPLSTPEQCFLEVAASGADLVELVVLGDSLVRARRTTPDKLLAVANRAHTYRCRAARRAARYVRSGVDSPQETRLRMLIVLAGLPEPGVNFILYREDGTWDRRFDMYYEEFKLLVEYDGRQHAEDSEQWESDIYRREDLARREMRTVTITRRGLDREPLRTLQRVRAALIECGATGLRATFRDDWRPFFTD